MDEYIDAMDLELNESEVDEILGLERECEFGEPMENQGEEKFMEETEGEEPEELGTVPVPVRKNAKKKEKRKARTASGAVGEMDEAISEELGENKSGRSKVAFQRIPVGEIPQLRNAIELPFPKVDSYDADGNLFVGGRILASSREVFSSYQAVGQSEQQNSVPESRKLESEKFESRKFESRELERKGAEYEELEDKKAVDGEGESEDVEYREQADTEQGNNGQTDKEQVSWEQGSNNQKEHKNQEFHGRSAVKYENHARESMDVREEKSKGSESNTIGSVYATGNIAGYFGMAAPVVERALANPKSKLYLSVLNGVTEHSAENGMVGTTEAGRKPFGNTGNIGKFQESVGKQGQIGVQRYGREAADHKVALGRGTQSVHTNTQEIHLEAAQGRDQERQGKDQEGQGKEQGRQHTYSHDVEPMDLRKGRGETNSSNAVENIVEENTADVKNIENNVIETQIAGENGNVAKGSSEQSVSHEVQHLLLESGRSDRQPGIYTFENIGNISEQGGRLVFRFVRGDVRDEEAAEQKGKEALIRRASFAAATMDVLAAGSVRYTYLEHLKHFQKGGETAYKLVDGGYIDVPGLLRSRWELRERLRNAGLRWSEIRDVMRNRKEIYETFQNVGDVLHAAEVGRIGLRKEEKAILQSKKVFNRKKYGKQTDRVINRMLRASDREVLRKTRFTQKTVRTMIRRAERYRISDSEVRLLRKWLRNDRRRAFLRFTSKGFVAYGKLLRNKADEQDDLVTAGRKKMGQIVFSVRASALVMVKSGSFVARTAGHLGGRISYGMAEGMTWTARKITGNQELDFHLIRRGKAAVQKKAGEIRKGVGEKAGQVRKEAGELKKKAVKRVQESKPVKRAVSFHKQAGERIRKVEDRFRRSKAGGFVRKVGKTAQKAGRIAKKPAKAMVKGAGFTVRAVWKPFQIAGNMWAGIRRAVAAVVKYVLIVLLAVSSVYVLMVFLNGSADSAIEAIKAWVEDSEENIICVEDGKTVQEWAAMLSVKDAELYKKAKELGEGAPKDPNVLHGKQIERYGHPANGGQAASVGYMIHYIDAYGNPVANATTNIKDVIALSCVMFGQEMETDQASREAFQELLADMYGLMNPELTYKESEIYTCVGSGCDSYSYFCNSDENYKEMDAMETESVGFYGTIRTQSGGCYCPGHAATWHHSKGDTSCPDIDNADDSCGGHEETTYDDGCQCRGHSVSVCYGHKDVDIYIKVIAKEYVFADNLLPSGWESKSYAGYIREFVANGAWSNRELSEWATHLCQQDWYSLYGVTVGNNYGFIVDGSEPHYEGGMFCFPLADYVRVSSDYGWRIHPISGERKFHSGIDFAATSGTAIYAAEDGTVADAGFNASMGNYVKIDHGNGLETVYMHASALYVKAGEAVEAGDVIAAVGSTGNSTGPHLHFSVTVNGSYVSPWPYLTGE